MCHSLALDLACLYGSSAAVSAGEEDDKLRQQDVWALTQTRRTHFTGAIYCPPHVPLQCARVL